MVMDKEYFGDKKQNDEEMERLRVQYKSWKKRLSVNNASFFMIYTDFKDEHLSSLSGGALKLYLYLGFHANNFTGECWHSIETISTFFGNDQRTVKKWFHELEEQKLIKRIQRGYKWVANTFLLPYGEFKDNNKGEL
jgi:hypothetical protein